MTRREAPVSPPVVLSIAGSDSGGGAGIQADLKTIEACGGFGTSAITSVTAQNTRGVQGSHLLPIDDIDAQIEAVRSDLDVAAVKTGMLATSDVIDLVVEHANDLPNLVVDPVMVAASGDRLLAREAEDAYEALIASASLVTPNADEAAVLTDVAVEDPESAERAGRILVEELGADAALVKGGHVAGDHVVDTLVTTQGGAVAGDAAVDRADTERSGDDSGDDVGVATYRHDRVDTDATHGSGCTLSSAIATHLAHGERLDAAVGAGIDLLARAVRYNIDVGGGPGAVHHLVELRNDANRQPTVDLVTMLAERVEDDEALASLVPPSGLGLVGATPHAEDPADVAGLVGRSLNGRAPEGRGSDAGASAGSPLAVGYRADDALASVLLAVREASPAIRFAALVSTSAATAECIAGRTLPAPALANHLDGTGPVPAAALESITGADRPPIALPLPQSGEGDEQRVVVTAETTTDLLDRLATLAVTD